MDFFKLIIIINKKNIGKEFIGYVEVVYYYIGKEKYFWLFYLIDDDNKYINSINGLDF